ncbi:hypothetical protein E2493_11995 [Sphingomonas parva]|uniref:Uncharacterized protein n=1 Tax=Sphingomonas parva TaxID=2555898 RepID=A0A4Y8ZRJ1_9SPHN|nr:hypothetical protein [Sphingomonas parva]TFI57912.1 hypothetical protein E2493_11995 [Sphingomonas parva]
MSSEKSDDRAVPAAGSTERPGAMQGAAGTETIRPVPSGNALGGDGGSGDYGAARGSGGSDLAETGRGGGSVRPTEPPSQVDDARRRSSGRGAATGAADGGVEGGPGGRTAGSGNPGGA